jgi:2-polyprenyl-3-methyl-5-hydroxy-6-metoxy-1,4-benzoquinol methylase
MALPNIEESQASTAAASGVNKPTEPLVSDYGWSTAEGPQACGYVTPAVLAILRSLRVHTVVDLGCGNGQLCAQLRAAGFDAVGVDADEAGIAIARATYPGIHFYQCGFDMDPTQLLHAEGRRCFDAVVSTEVIEHLFSPHLLPRYAWGLLPAGGYLVMSTPYHGYLKNLMLSVFNKWDHHHTALWHGGHIKFWSLRTLSQLLECNGFTVTGFRGAGRLRLLWKSMIITARRQTPAGTSAAP